MLLNHLLLVFLWVLYGAVHSVLAAGQTKRWVERRWPLAFRHYRLAYNLLAFAGLAAVVWFQFSFATKPLFVRNLFTNLCGVLLAAGGLGLMLVCIKKYFLSLSGLQTLWKEEKSDALMIAGVHRYVRHPLYLGTFAFLWGLLLLFPTFSLLVCSAVVTGYTLLGIRWEEKKLLGRFGEAYRIYRQQVPMLLPKFR